MISKIKPDQNVDTTGIEIQYCKPYERNMESLNSKERFNSPISKKGQLMRKRKKCASINTDQ